MKIRHPTRHDGAAIHRITRDTGVLDVNSAYAYLIMATRFSDTTVVAEDDDGAVVGFITGFIPPRRPDVLFVWQVGVDASARGQGAATRMLMALVEAPACRGVRWVETTVSLSNTPSQRMFQGLARRLECDIDVAPEDGFTAADFGSSDHEDEPLYRIGPFRRPNS